MLLNISKIGKILKETNRLAGEFNTSIPLKVEIKKEINPITYLIKLGNREVETKSFVPLKVGNKYLANVTEKKGKITIQNLKPYPKLLELLEKLPLKKEQNLTKEKILEHLSHAKSKEEFLFYANILFAFQKGIRHIFINEKNNQGIMQFKYEKNRITFYAAFKFLGELKGEITPYKVTIYTPFKNVASLILQNSDKIDKKVEVFVNDSINSMFEFKNSLLDIKA
jgi:hypothetical protein